MSWLLVAFVAPVLWAVSTHIDKYLVERYFKERDVAVLLVFTALIGLVLLPFIALYAPGVTSLPLASIVVIAATGLLYMVAMYFYLRALQSNEASIVAPFYQAAPLFAYGLAYVVLGEVLTRSQLAGALLIVGGTVFASLNVSGAKSRINVRLVLLMLACAFSLAVSSIVFKLFAVREEFWPTTFWTYAGEAVFGAGVLAIPSERALFASLFRTNPAAVIGINGLNEIINLAGSLIARYALLLAPVGLISAVSSTTTIFVFLIGIGLTLFAPRISRESLSRADLIQKAVAVVLVGGGVALLLATTTR